MIYQPYQWGGGYTKSEVDTLLNGKSDTSHTHTKSQITDFPTIPSKTSDLTNDLGFISSEIDSMGEGWVRFKCGLQICWGVSNMVQVNNIHSTVQFQVSYKAFKSKPSLSLAPLNGANGWAQLLWSIAPITPTYANIRVWNNGVENIAGESQYLWQAIGYWK